MKNTYTSLRTALLLTVVALAGIQFSSARAMAQQPASSNSTMIYGMVSCLDCRGTCPRKTETLWTCTLRRVHSGDPYVLVIHDQRYLLKGNIADLDKFAGGDAAVQGHFDGSSIIADSVMDVKAARKIEDASKSAK